MTDIVVETRSLSKNYGAIQALVDANFKIGLGEHVAIVGDNGAGKSTLVRQISGVEQPTSGEILIDGRHVFFENSIDARNAGIETVFQDLALAEDLDVPSNIFLGREMVHFPLGPFSPLNMRKMNEQALIGLDITAVKIPNIYNPIRNMSGGQRQCVAIARSATFASKLIIMDEPTAALGVQETTQVENIIRTLKKKGISLILVSHNLRQVFDLMDRVVVLRRGRIVGSVDTNNTSSNMIISMITGVQQTDKSPEGTLVRI